MKSLRKQIRYNDLTFHISRRVYEPADDTYLVADNLTVSEGDVVLDMGTGCGILAVLAAQRAKKVVAVDINPNAIRCAKGNARVNSVADRIDLRRGDLFQPISDKERFSLIIFNAPYLPSTPKESRSWLGKSWAGGRTGRELIDRFITKAPCHLQKNGRILLVQSSLANLEETLEKLRKAGFSARVIAEKRFPFEAIVVVQASHLSE